MSFKMLVIGGTAAGLSAASKAKRINPEIDITVYEQSGYVSYGACGLPYYLGDMIKDADDLISLNAETLSKKRGIPTFIHHKVLEIDRNKKTLKVLNIDTKEEFEVHYDKLVIATGAKPAVPNIKGVDTNGVHFLRTVEDGIKIKSSLKTGSVKKIGIIGGGFIGLEVAEQMRESGFEVVILEAMPRLLPMLSENDSELVCNTLTKHGIDVIFNASVEEILSTSENISGIKLKNGEIIDVDMAIISAGVNPNTEIAAKAGLKLGIKNAIVVDRYQQTSDPDIYAAGDCVQMINSITNETCYVPLGTTANKQGRIAGGNVAGEIDTFDGVLGSGVTKIFDLYVAITGLSLNQALEAGFDAVSERIIKGDKASYYPGSQDNMLTLVFERKTGRLLGAQALGSESVSGRMNALVVAVSAKMTIDDINRLDLVYSPSVAPVYDPILIAASQSLKKV